jgi:hypothetical protein
VFLCPEGLMDTDLLAVFISCFVRKVVPVEVCKICSARTIHGAV